MKSIVFASAYRRKPSRPKPSSDSRSCRASPTWRCGGTEPSLGAIIETGSKLMAGADFRTYRVRARRSQKSIPFRSIEVARQLGLRIRLDAEAADRQVKVDLENAEATCYVEVTPSRALLYRDKIPGVGGLPMARPANWCACFREDLTRPLRPTRSSNGACG